MKVIYIGLEQIDREVMALFDEFDKTFGDAKKERDKACVQMHFLSLSDGISPVKGMN